MGKKFNRGDRVRPAVWKYGEDQVVHQLHTWSMRARSQAWYRGEEWLLTDQEYIDLWLEDEKYKLRGRGVDNYCLTRKDPEGSWSLDNVHVISRLEHYKTCNNFKGGWKTDAQARNKKYEQL
jgi:hypothetical protein